MKKVAQVLLGVMFIVVGISVLSDSAQAARNSKRKPSSKGATITCRNTVDIGSLSNVLYKSSNVHGGRGRTWLDQGHRLGGTRRLSVAGLNGKVFGCFGLWACDHPYGCRYYQAMCGDSNTNSQFAAKARANGGTTYAVVSSGKGTCYKFNAASSRYGNVVK